MAKLSILQENSFEAYDRASPAALVIAEAAGAVEAACAALALAGCQARAPIDFAAAAGDHGHFDGIDLILIEADSAPEGLVDIVLARADAVARERVLGVIATVLPEQIDRAVALLLAPGGELLFAPPRSDPLWAIAPARWRARGQLNDATRDAESVRLQRLNEEVARIADTLARLTRGEEAERRGGVRDPGSDYRGPDEAGTPVSAQEIRATIRARRLRAQFFAGELFADPAWDMLLDLFAAGLERRRVSVSSLCIAAAVPPTTALRWIATMHDAGLFERQADPSDRRRAYIGLSAKGLEGMRNYASAVKRAGLGLV